MRKINTEIYVPFRLLNWIQSKVPDIPISNFTTDWNDGKAVGALVDAVAPGNIIRPATSWFCQQNIQRPFNLKIIIYICRLMSGLAGLEIQQRT